jgi:ribonuclease HI
VLVDGEPRYVKNGGDPSTTNNLMELEGAIQGLRYLRRHPEVVGTISLVSDSQYVLGLASGKSSPSKNVEKATELRNLAIELKVSTRWVRGHSGDHWNEVCDRLSRAGKEAQNV